MPRSAARASVLTVCAVLFSLVTLTVPSSAAPATNDAMIRAAHFSPDTPGVDVYLTSFSGGKTTALWLSGVGYGAVSPYRRIPSGLYAVSMRLHGAAASSPPALSWTLNAQAGSSYTAAGVGMNAQLHGVVLPDNLSMPASGHGNVRVIQAASRAPKLDVAVVNGTSLVQGQAFGTSSAYASVPAGDWSVQARSVTSPGVSATTNLKVAAGTVSSVIVLDAKAASGIRIMTVVDAAAVSSVPSGSVNAGAGGTAPRPATSVPSLAWIAGSCLAAFAGLLLFRRQASAGGAHRR